MTIKSIDKSAAHRIATRIEADLQPLAKELGIQIKTGSGSFSNDNFTMKVVVSTIGDNGEANTPEGDAFKQYAYQLGLKPEDLGRMFKNDRGDLCYLVGYKPRSRKYPILYVNETDGKRYKTTVAALLKHLGEDSPSQALEGAEYDVVNTNR